MSELSDNAWGLLSESSLGGKAWCSRCNHPVVAHQQDDQTLSCYAGVPDPDDPDATLICNCYKFLPMTPEEWRRRH